MTMSKFQSKVQTYIVGVSGVATASLLVVAENPDQAEDAVATWLESHNPEDQKGTKPKLDDWDVEVGSTDVWRVGSGVADAIVAAEVLVLVFDNSPASE